MQCWRTVQCNANPPKASHLISTCRSPPLPPRSRACCAVSALILLSADHELVPFLDRRVVSPLWNVCLKCLTLVHKLSLEADERFLTELQSAPSLLSGVPEHFDTSVDPTATAHSRFIHAYAAYLQAKVKSFAALHVSCERQQPADSRRWVMRLKVLTLVRAVPLMQRQFDALLLVAPANSEDLNHPIPIAAMTLVIKDAFRLYSVLTVMMLAVLERYESMSLPQTERMLAATRKFLAQNSKFRKWADRLCKNGFVDKKLLPKFDAVRQPTTSNTHTHTHTGRATRTTELSSAHCAVYVCCMHVCMCVCVCVCVCSDSCYISSAAGRAHRRAWGHSIQPQHATLSKTRCSAAPLMHLTETPSYFLTSPAHSTCCVAVCPVSSVLCLFLHSGCGE